MRPLERHQLKRDGPCPCVFSFKARALTKGACCRFLNLACSREPGGLIPRIGEKVEDLLNRSLDEDLTLSRDHGAPHAYLPTADAEENCHDYRALSVHRSRTRRSPNDPQRRNVTASHALEEGHTVEAIVGAGRKLAILVSLT